MTDVCLSARGQEGRLTEEEMTNLRKGEGAWAKRYYPRYRGFVTRWEKGKRDQLA